MYIREPFPHTRLKIRELLGIEAQFRRLGRWETLRKIVHEDYSVARYGDGELSYFLKRRSLRFQPYYRDLGDRLHEAIMTPKQNLLICFNNNFRDSDRYKSINLAELSSGEGNDSNGEPYQLGPDRRRERRSYVERWIRIARRTQIRTFGDATCFRITGYVDEHANGLLEAVKEDFRSLFRGRRILFICPESPLAGQSFKELEPKLRRIGLRDAQYIFIPNQDAAEVELDIRRELEQKSGYDDIFIQAGPFATVLAYELAGAVDGRIIDVGALNKAVPIFAD
jgi:hypothetical protein